MCDIFLCTYRCLSCWAVDVAAMSPVIPRMLQVRAQLRSVQGSWHSSEQPVLTEDLKQTQQTLSSCVGNLKKKKYLLTKFSMKRKWYSPLFDAVAFLISCTDSCSSRTCWRLSSRTEYVLGAAAGEWGVTLMVGRGPVGGRGAVAGNIMGSPATMSNTWG